MTDGPQNASPEVLRGILDQWWDPPAALVATIPKGGVALQYVGHADVTRALIETDPSWSWEPMGFTDDGQPVLVVNDAGQPIGMWGWLTVCGVRRPGYGSCLPGKNEAVKELVGDFIRNAALRFGFCGGLWSKADRTEQDEKPPAKPADADKKAKGQAVYDSLVAEYGKETVNGALAVHNVARYQELTPVKVKAIEASLKSRAVLVQLQEDLGAKPEAE